MSELVLALDLGTGGCKASVWSAESECLAESVVDYPTLHPRAGWNEQRPEDWWDAVVGATRTLMATSPEFKHRIAGIAVSGHSLGVVMLDAHHRPLGETTPIWSDTRATAQAAAYFARVDEESWYTTTGNGFTPALYPIFKAMWFRHHRTEDWSTTRYLVGSKDYVNLRLTGTLVTDHSYASGSGCYDLRERRYDQTLLAAAGLDISLLPPIVESTDQVGTLTAQAADQLSLPGSTPVFAGGVDNACMALGSRGVTSGRMYASLGSSSWITVTSSDPVLDTHSRPFVFAHVVPGLYVSALSTFSSGTTMTWLRDLLAPGTTMRDFVTEACTAPLGADGLLFLPMLSGGTPLEGGTEARGVLHGMDLAHRRPHIARAALEGIAASLRRGLDIIGEFATDDSAVLISGGGSRHPGWNQIYADVFNAPLLRTTVDQQAAALGAAATALVGAGVWSTFNEAERPHIPKERYEPNQANAAKYTTLCTRFNEAVAAMTRLRHAST
ncbi:FGGY family carbohydrate kinase [Streptomyces sp. NPDC050636]|uniref:xylulokinase n=1 Tax=Streptomyces sp. NPDC050636 TaxID=3154510 RepID=UPI00342D295C